MSITLPPLPHIAGETFTLEYMQMYAHTFAIGAVIADRASRVPTIDYAELHEFARVQRVDYNDLCCIVRRALIPSIGEKP